MYLYYASILQMLLWHFLFLILIFPVLYGTLVAGRHFRKYELGFGSYERGLDMKKILLEALLRECREQDYQKQYEYIVNLLKDMKIKPVKASRLNGKSPALYREYWLLEETRDYSDYIEELRYQIVPDISVDYYLRHLESYEADREWVLQLNQYLKNKKGALQFKVSANERSFEIWGREKFLSRGQGKRILKRCGLELSFFNIYDTTEPLAYYSRTRQVPQNLLILENKDTFFSMRRHLLEGNEMILGTKIDTLIYGAGKGIFRSFEDFDLCVEPYMKAEGNQIYYFGDLDYEGIGIYENLSELFSKEWNIVPFVAAYGEMLKKAETAVNIPETKEGQNKNIKNLFFSYFSEKQIDKMKEILEKGCYIPQEILNISDF